MLDYLLLFVGLIAICRLLYALFNSREKYNINQAVVLVTGAGSGLGQQICFKLADENCRIICVDISESGNSDTVHQIKKTHPNCLVKSYICDVSNYGQVKQLVKEVLNEFDHIDVLINNAGIIRGDVFENFTENELRKIVDVNVLGTFLITNELLPSMKRRNQGCIVSISSLGGLAGCRHIVPYCATKFAVTGFMQALNKELRFCGSNVRTVCVYPCFMKTKMLRNISSNDSFVRRWMYMANPDKVAIDIVNGIKNGISDVYPRKELFFGFKLSEFIPSLANMAYDCVPLEDFVGNTMNSDDKNCKNK